MRTRIWHPLTRALFTAAAALLLAACADRATAPEGQAALAGREAPAPEGARQALALLRRVTARYHDLDAAIADDFILLHPCESRPGEGPVGIVYYNGDRLMDFEVDPALPDALIYEPSDNGRPKLVGVEFAVPDLGQEAPRFLGVEFQREEEFGVFALHVWVWRHNPEGMFAEANPRVTCGAE
jgi:hypothetical protein